MTGILPRGVIAPNLTPFRDDLSVDTDRYVEHARSLLADGCVGLAPFGTTGEALSVGVAERKDALQALVDGGIDPKCLIPGTGLTNLPDTIELTRHALDLDCAAVMTLPAFYFKGVSDDGLHAYFTRLIEGVDHPDLKIYLYHIPQVSGVGLPVDLVRRLRREFPDQIIGIKDSSGDWQNTAALLEIEGLIVYPGSELPLIEAMALGAPGCISATANLNAAAIATSVELIASGKDDEASTHHAEVRKFREIVQGYAPIPAQKRLLALGSGQADWANVRPPLLPMSEDAGRDLVQELTRAGLKSGN